MKTQPTHRPFPYYRKSAGGGGGLLFPSPPPVIWPSNAWEKEEEEGGGGGVPGFFLALITFLLLHHHRGRHASERTDGISTIYFTTIYSMSVLLSSGVDVVRIHIFSRFTWQIPVPIYRRTVSGSFLPPSLHPTRPPPSFLGNHISAIWSPNNTPPPPRRAKRFFPPPPQHLQRGNRGSKGKLAFSCVCVSDWLHGCAGFEKHVLGIRRLSSTAERRKHVARGEHGLAGGISL